MNGIDGHYGGPDLAARILQLAGTDKPDAASLAPYDEFHVGGRRATLYLAGKLELKPGMTILDIGSGLGGAARAMAEQGVSVEGIDLTPDYVAAAADLSRACGLSDCTRFVVGDATALPFAGGAFDAAYTIHAAMNIPDKAAFYREARRVLKPGGRFALYDALAGTGGPLAFPVPWAPNADLSFLLPPERILTLLQESGFRIMDREDRTAYALSVLAKAISTPGPRLVMGPDASLKLTNLMENLRSGRCHLWQIVAMAC